MLLHELWCSYKRLEYSRRDGDVVGLLYQNYHIQISITHECFKEYTPQPISSEMSNVYENNYWIDSFIHACCEIFVQIYIKYEYN